MVSFQNIRCNPGHNEVQHQQVDKMKHYSDITKNRTSFKKIYKRTRQELAKVSGKEPTATFKGDAGTSEKYWLLSACDNNLPYSSHVLAISQKNIHAPLTHPKLCSKICDCLLVRKKKSISPKEHHTQGEAWGWQHPLCFRAIFLQPEFYQLGGNHEEPQIGHGQIPVNFSAKESDV